MIPVVTLGEALIDMIPAEGGKNLSDTSLFSRRAGGAPANVAVQAARLGADARFIGKVGSDAFGLFLRRALRENGVDVTGLLETDEARTALAFVSRVEEDENPFTFYRDPAADQLLRPDEVPAEVLEGPGIFHFGSVSLSAEPVRSATREAATEARKRGMLVSFDPNIRPPLWKSAAEAVAQIRSMLAHAHIVKLSRSELAALTGERGGREPLQLARRFRGEHGIPFLIVSLGSAGCLYVTPSGSGNIPAPPVEAVDPTGAGDALTGALLSRLAREEIGPEALEKRLAEEDWLRETLTFAVGVASHSTTKPGAIASYAGLGDLNRLNLL